MAGAGNTKVLTGEGASSYVWTGAITNGQGFIPTITTTYTVAGTDENNCSNTATITIIVIPPPDIAIDLSGLTISANQNRAMW